MIKRGFLAGLAAFVFGFIFNGLFNFLVPGLALEYQNEAVFRPWTDPLMMLFFTHPFIMGMAATYLWDMLNKNFRGSPSAKAMQFVKVYFLAVTIPGMFASYTSFQLSAMMIFSWMLLGISQIYVIGLVLAKSK